MDYRLMSAGMPILVDPECHDLISPFGLKRDVPTLIEFCAVQFFHRRGRVQSSVSQNDIVLQE